MPLRDEENFAYIDVSRPVTGVDDFLNTVRHRGNAIFGTDESSLLVDSVDAAEVETGEDEYEPILLINTTGAPRLEVYGRDELRVTLLHQRQPLELNKTGRLNWAGRRLTRIEEIPYNPINPDQEPVTSALYDVLTRAGYKYDIPQQDNVPIRFSGVTLNPDPELDVKGVELALILDPADPATLMTAEHVDICFRGLAGISKSTIYPTHGAVPLNMPFARLPLDVKPDELTTMIKVVDDLLPIRGIMGSIRPQPTVHN